MSNFMTDFIKGKIQINDEPQHKFQGQITLNQLKFIVQEIIT